MILIVPVIIGIVVWILHITNVIGNASMKRQQLPTEKVSLPVGQLDNPNKDKSHHLSHQVFIILLVLVIIGAVAWILSIVNVIGYSPWSSIFSALFTIISVVVAVPQFLLELSSSQNGLTDGSHVRSHKSI
jgi:hypothetical protein